MSALLATLIDGGALLQTAVASVVAGAGITLAFSLGILGTTRAGDLRSSGRSVAAAIALGLGVLAFAVSIAGVGLGLAVMISS